MTRKSPAAASQRSSASALYRLLAWLSPAYPVGAFSYSSGIEWAVEAGDIRDVASLIDWISVLLSDGSGFTDSVLFVHAHRAAVAADWVALRDLAELATALVSSKERHLETTTQGSAFVAATRRAWPCDALDRLAAHWDGAVCYPIAVAVASAGHAVPLEAALPAFVQAVAANWISAGVRLIPLGQSDGLRALAALEGAIAAAANAGLETSLDQMGSATFRADLAGMHHETQYTRLFRS